MGDLEIKDLVVEYSSGGYAVRPIDGFGATITAGSLSILLGPSGCGKTTLLSCLGGILTPTSGSIHFGDTDVTGLRDKALTDYRRTQVGIVFQAFNLVPSLTAQENVAIPLRVNGVGRREAKQRSAELLERVDLASRAGHRPGDLSGGQQQRVAVARALAMDPPLILADEPTAHLDYIQVEGVLKLLRELARDDRIVVVVTHDDRIIPLADQVVELVPKFRTDRREPETVSLKAGEELFAQGDWGELIYIIEKGEIDIIRRLDDGSEDLRATLTDGDYFGEMAPTFKIQRSATARARNASTLTGYTLIDFREKIGTESLPAMLNEARDTRD